MRCITLLVLLSFKWRWEKCFPSWLSGPPLSFHILLLSPLLSTDAPSYLPLIPHSSFSSLPSILHSSVSSSSSILPWLYHFVLVIPTALPCPQHPSHFLLLPLASLGSGAISAGGNPTEHFPTTCSPDQCPNSDGRTMSHVQGTW